MSRYLCQVCKKEISRIDKVIDNRICQKCVREQQMSEVSEIIIQAIADKNHAETERRTTRRILARLNEAGFVIVPKCPTKKNK